ncbi:MAG TPA: ferrous iron transport protein B [Acidobacteriota bacterium]
MISDSLADIRKIQKDVQYTIALAGNPNVGKSTIFNRLTGLGAVTANYPGKTVSLNIGSADYKGTKIGIIDLPGTYSLGTLSDDQLVARREILEGRADVLVSILDATNLERNLYLVIQLLDLGFPVIIGLNLMDLAAKQNICLNIEELSRLLGVPVIPLVGTTGEGLDQLIAMCLSVARGETKLQPRLPKYGKDINHYLNGLSRDVGRYLKKIPYHLSPRALAILLLEDDEEFKALIKKEKKCSLLGKRLKDVRAEIQRTHGESASLRLTRERHGYEGTIVDRVQSIGVCRPSISSRLWRLSLEPITGLPILLAGLAAVFSLMYYIGGFLSRGFDRIWSLYVSPHIIHLVQALLGNTPVSRTVLWGLDAGVQASLSVGVPYILTFYFLLAFLEDTGYLNSVAFLSDSVMHKIGLHGRSAIPIISGAGCNVPAILGTRVLTTYREKVIASTLITLVPCSARTAVIMGAVAFFIGWPWALAIYVIDFIIGVLVGRGLAVFLPGESSGLVMEMFPFRMPKFSTILKKTWFRFKEFLIVAIPIIAIGSLLLGFLYETKLMWQITRPLSFIIKGWLGLPAVAGICLLFGILRKELALQLLVALAIIHYGTGIKDLSSFMSNQQIFIFALITTLYIPCLATISVLVKELGWKTAAGISLLTITIALIVGGLANQLLNIFHLIR